jgi:hypothetical protein
MKGGRTDTSETAEVADDLARTGDAGGADPASPVTVLVREDSVKLSTGGQHEFAPPRS